MGRSILAKILNKLASKKNISYDKGIRNFAVSDNAANKNLPLVGAGWQTAVIQGMTDYLMQRAKDEFTYAFIDDLKKLFTITASENCKELYQKKFMIEVFHNFSNIILHSEQFDFKNYIPTLRSALIEDFQNLPFSLVHSSIDNIQNFNGTSRAITKISIDRLEEIFNGENPYISLSKLADEDIDFHDLNDNRIKQVLKITGRIAREYYYISNTNVLISDANLGSLSDMLSDTRIRKLFLRFLFEDSNGVINSKFNDQKQEMALLKIANNFRNIDIVIDNIKRNEDSNLFYKNYADYFKVFASTIAATDGFLENKSIEWNRFGGIFDTLTKIQVSVIERDYNKAILYALGLIDTNLLSKKIRRTISFGANLASITKKEDVIIAIQSYADPVGSYRNKRIKDENKYLSFSINSYIGFNFGKEYLVSSINGVNDKTNFYRSVYMPVGFEVNICTKGSWIPSVGLFVSPIDLGTLASYRSLDNSWNNFTVEDNRDISFKTVFAPSVALVFGITKNKPITFSFGYQYAPEQRVLQNNTLKIDKTLDVKHMFINFAMDLTLLNF